MNFCMPMPLPRLVSCLYVLGSVFLVIGCSAEKDRSEVQGSDHTQIEHTATNVWTDHGTAPLQFKREQTFGTADEPGKSVLADAHGLAVDSNGTVYILDRGNHRLVAFNPDGSVRWTAGRHGQGPGEFFLPEALVWNEDEHLYVSNQFGARIDVWDTTGAFQERHSLDDVERPSGLSGVVDDFLISTSTGFGDTPPHVHVIDTTTWTLHTSFDIGPSHNLPENAGITFDVAVDEGGLWAGNIATYSVRRYTRDGTKTHEITRSNVSLPEIKAIGHDEGGPRLETRSRIAAPLRLDSGHLLVASNWQTNPEEHTAGLDAGHERAAGATRFDEGYTSAVDLFDPEGAFMGRLQWEGKPIPGIGQLRTVGPDGKLYTYRSDPFPQVRRYAVSVDD